MKKKILVVFTGAMELGGIERSLLGLLDSFDYEQYDVDLFLYAHHGPLFSLINPRVNLLPEVRELAYLRESMKEKLAHGCFLSAAMRLKDGIVSHIKEVDFDRTWASIMRRCAPKLKTHYDMAISFFRPFDYISEKVDADLKIGWIHTDYSSFDINTTALFEDYERLDMIAAVSEECKKSFCSLFPQFNDKTIVVENILAKSFILKQAADKMDDPLFKREEDFALLSVGRYCTAKNFDNIPAICRILVEKGLPVRWYLIGFGEDEALIRDKIRESEMQDHVILLGKKENPYPYFKACDLYVQPSRYEGKCVAVREAQMLCKPVVITKYATAFSQLQDGYDGMIVPMDNEGCADGIASILQDKEKRQLLIAHMQTGDYTNVNEIRKIYGLMSTQNEE